MSSNLTLVSSARQEAALRDGTIDLGFGFGPFKRIKGIKSIKLCDDPVSIARIGKDHLAARLPEPVSIRTHLFGSPLVMFRRELNPALYARLAKAIRRAGHRGEILELSDHAPDTWRRGALKTDCGWAPAQLSEAGVEDGFTVCKRLSDLDVAMSVEIRWISDRPNPLVRRIGNYLENGYEI